MFSDHLSSDANYELVNRCFCEDKAWVFSLVRITPRLVNQIENLNPKEFICCPSTAPQSQHLIHCHWEVGKSKPTVWCCKSYCDLILCFQPPLHMPQRVHYLAVVLQSGNIGLPNPSPPTCLTARSPRKERVYYYLNCCEKGRTTPNHLDWNWAFWELTAYGTIQI